MHTATYVDPLFNENVSIQLTEIQVLVFFPPGNIYVCFVI